MNKENIKLIIKDIESLIKSLKEELELHNISEYNYEEISTHLIDYDEIFYDENE